MNIHFDEPRDRDEDDDDIAIQAQAEIRVFANAAGQITIEAVQYLPYANVEGGTLITIDPSKVEALVHALRHVKKHGFK